MTISLGLNISSAKAQRELSNTSDSLSSIFERLSSGQRINRASDDAAGLAVASELNVDARVYTQGIRNINDGISLLSIADSTIDSLSGIATRIRELASQASNGTLSQQQRASLDLEAQELSEEYSRIARSSSFNDINLFDGSLEQGLSVQLGYGTDGNIRGGLGSNLGDGAFDSGVSIGSSAFSVALGDINGDGNLDAIGGARSIRLGNGDGSFGSAVSIGAEHDSAVADINNDGVLDLVSAGSGFGGGYGNIRIGNGDGTFQSVSTFSTASVGPSEVQLVDLNGDGNQDILAYGNRGAEVSVAIALGTGDGTFEDTVAVDFFEAENDYGIDLGDFNGDGILDLVATGLEEGNTSTSTIIRLGNGDGTFQASSTIFESTSTNVRGVAAGDLNQDGFDDVVMGGQSGSRIYMQLSNGDGTFQSVVSLDSTVSNHRDLLVKDFNGDGQKDIAIGGSELAVFLGAGDGSFSEATSFSSPTFSREIVAGDINNDGVYDLVSANSQATVFLGQTREGINPLLDFSLLTQADAKQAASQLDQKLDQLTTQRGTVGALQSRLGSSLNVLQSTAENYRSAESRIVDADIAEETSKLTRLQILQQSVTAVLAQANQQPALALSLLT